MNTNNFVILILILFPVFASAAEWYQSNPAGVPESPLEGQQPTNTGWSLSIDTTGSVETKTLYRDGILHETQLTTRTKGQLIQWEQLDHTGTRLSLIRYAYDADGHPRVILSESSRPFNVSMTPTSPLSPQTQITEGHNTTWSQTEYNNDHQPLKTNRTVNGETQNNTEWLRYQDGSYTRKTQTSDGIETTTRFDTNGRLIKKTILTDGKLTLIETNQWNGTQLIRQEKREGGTITVRNLTWSGKTLKRETTTVNGIISNRTEQLGKNQTIEILYRDGTETVRVLWENGTIKREEFMEDGKIVRVREYQG